MNELAHIPYEGSPVFASLSDAGRDKVRARCAAVGRILDCKKDKKTAVLIEAQRLGIKCSRMRGLVSDFKNWSGRADQRWMALIDWRAEPHKEQAIPGAFLEFWRALAESYQRSTLAAHRELSRLYWSGATEYTFPEGDTIPLWPGYAERPEPSPASREGLPRGWSYDNLTKPGTGCSKLELTRARLGPIAASDLEEQIFTTRVGLRPGEFYVFDDCWSDLQVAVPPSLSKKSVRPVELGCGDVFSGKKIAWGIKPLIENAQGKRAFIRERDMRYLLAKVLCDVGFHKDGVTLLVEHGTAAISQELEFTLCVMSGGRVEEREVRNKSGKMERRRMIVEPGLIRVKRSGIKGGKNFGGGFDTLGKGNFRFKAGYESQHNLCHNERSNIPGQTGNNSRIAPVEDLVGREAEHVKLMTAALEINPHIFAEIKTGFTTLANYIWAHDRVEAQIGSYRDHHLQGWAEAGLCKSVFRLDVTQPWQPMSELLKIEDPGKRAAIETYIAGKDYLTTELKMSRNEAWLSGRADLIRLPSHCVPEILGPSCAEVRWVEDDNTIQFFDEAIGTDKLIFSSYVKTPSGASDFLTPRVKYRTWVNPFDFTKLFVSTLEGNFIGVCEAKHRLDKRDDEAYAREAGQVKKNQLAVIKPYLDRAAVRQAQVTRDRKNNITALTTPQAADTTITDYDLPDYTLGKE